MVSLPPGPQRQQSQPSPPPNPSSPSHVEPGAVGGTNGASKRKKPEAVRYMVACWATMIFGELVHQILSVTAIVVDPTALKEAAAEAAKKQGAPVTDAAMQAGIWGSVIVMGLIQLSIILLFAAALSTLNAQKRWAPGARRLLQVFSVYFAARALMLFVMRPAATTIPVAFYAFDGIIQIIIGVAGALGVFYASQKESRDWADAGAPKQSGKDSGKENPDA